MNRMKTRAICGQKSFLIATKTVEAAVTETGGHLAPVTFKLGRQTVQPFAIAPWWKEKLTSDIPPILRVLRGDFFCLPFGANTQPYHGERHPVHGETANARWKCAGIEHGAQSVTLHLTLNTKIRRGRVDKRIRLISGHPVVYQEHTLTGFRGPMNFGHHATLQFPDHEGAGRLSTSRVAYAQVPPEPVENPAAKGYSMLQPGAVFHSLSAVPTITGDTTDLSHYPARRGFEDIVLLVADPNLKLAWTAVAFPDQRYVWFALRDPRVLAATLLWLSNGGRHYPPWNGRHVNVLGVEDLTAYFHYGLAASAAPNLLTEAGYRTHHVLDPDRPFTLRYIMGVAPISDEFDRVAELKCNSDHVTLVSTDGEETTVPLDVKFLHT